MQILFLTQIIPFPPDAGPKVKTWNVLRYLVERGYQITLLSFVRPEELEYVPKLRELGLTVYTVPIARSRLKDIIYWFWSHLTRRPFLIERDDLPEMRKTILDLVGNHHFDVIHADQLTMAQFALFGKEQAKQPKPRTVFDAHNAVWTIVDRMMKNAPWFLKPILAIEANRIREYEGKLICSFDQTLAVTEEDERALIMAMPPSEQGKAAITVIPIAVDTTVLLPVPRPQSSMNILTLGTLHYPPNADGIRWFANEVFPIVHRQIKESTLTVVGKNPPPDLLQLGVNHPDSIEITGYVPDLQPYLERAAIMVVPVRAGGGMRVRILEAFARGIPVVTTTVGLEGIRARPGEDVLVEDTPADFARAVIRLLTEPGLQAQLTENGRKLAEAHYDWRVVLRKMDTVYGNPGV